MIRLAESQDEEEHRQLQSVLCLLKRKNPKETYENKIEIVW